MRRFEQEGARPLPAMPLSDLHVADMQRIALFSQPKQTDRLVIDFENEVFRFLPTREKEIGPPGEPMALVIMAQESVG